MSVLHDNTSCGYCNEYPQLVLIETQAKSFVHYQEMPTLVSLSSSLVIAIIL